MAMPTKKEETGLERVISLLEEDRELWAIASLHQEQEQESRNYLSYLQWFFLYTVFIFILGMYTGYKYRDTIEHFGSHCYALFQAGDHHGIPETTR